jgi:hypothetical protein
LPRWVLRLFRTRNQQKLLSNSDGGANTAVGFQALNSNTTGVLNTANGAGALSSNTTGGSNTADGNGALNSNTTGDLNTANGDAALAANTTGSNNTADGVSALTSNTTGNNNTANGFNALVNSTGDGNTAIGANAGMNVATANNVIAIGHDGADVSNTTWIGNVFGVTTQNGMTAAVVVSADGQLGTVASSERFKKDIAAMDKASDVILSLRPVTFHYKTDGENTPQFGLIAEEVAKASPALVLPDKEGKPYTVRYDAVNAMLLNEFLKEHRKVEQLEASNAQQQRNFAQQQKAFESKLEKQEKQIDALTAELQKVSAQLEVSKTAPQTVVNNR